MSVEPLPEDVLADAREMLDKVIRPELPPGFAREQAGLLSSLLEHVRLRTMLEHDALVEDCRDARAVLTALHVDPSVEARVVEIDDSASTAVGLTRLRGESRQLRAVLADVVDLAEGAAEPDEEALVEVRALLRRQLDRERTMIGPGYPRGT